MTLDMHDERFITLGQLETFTSAAHGLNFVGRTRKEKYDWTEKILTRFMYFTLRKRDKTTIQKYIMKITGYEDAQVTRLVRKKKKTRHIIPASRDECCSFPKKYTSEDIVLLVATDSAHGRLSGKATKEIFRRTSDIFHDEAFSHLKDISVSHLYNLRETRQYVCMGYVYIQKQHATKINIFYQTHFNMYVNYHRPSGYATTTVNAKGKEKKVYNLYEPPYEHFKKLPNAETYLQDGLTFKELDGIAYAENDNACATMMQEAKYQLFKSFRD